MRILSWNIRHGGGSRTDRIIAAIASHAPDIVVLPEFRDDGHGQEIRRAFETLGLIHQSEALAGPKVNSVLVASAREFDAPPPPPGLGQYKHRFIAAKFASFCILAVYFPQKLDKKPLFELLLAETPQYISRAAMIIGDFNTGRHREDELGATFYCSEDFEALLTAGWSDAWRSRNPEGREYSWYSPAGNGFRIDHAFVSPELNRSIRGVCYSQNERLDGISDHAALILDIDL